MKRLRMLVVYLTVSAASVVQGAQQTNAPEHSTSVQQDSQPGSMASSANKGDRTITGCIRSNNGKYRLESKHKMIWLTGAEDLASHVGHTVSAHGSFLSSTGTSSAGLGSDFQVKQIDMVADSCSKARSQ